MISAVIYTRGHRPCGFRVSGHAYYAEPGYDIVCSAVSALTQTALLGILNTVGAKADYSIDDDGILECTLTEDDKAKLKDCELIIRVMYDGLCNIKENYEEYLSLTEREV